MTAAEYIAAAVARSYRNRGEVLADAALELLGVLSRLFVQYYATAAGLNPAVFATQAVVAFDGQGWPVPADADTVIRLERTGGAEVVVVPLEQRQSEPSEAAVYRMGPRYYGAGNPNDPVDGPLVVYYTQRPPAFTALSTPAPAGWPLHFDEMVVVDLAAWLAKKDGRADDVALLEREQGAWAALYREWLSRETLGTVRAFGQPTLVPSPNVATATVRG